MIVDRFSAEVAGKLGAYVYRLVDPRTRRTFYVGKGRGNRVFEHARLSIEEDEVGLRYEHIRELDAAGLSPEIVIHRHGLDDALALEVEAALIDAYADHDLTNAVRGHGGERGANSALRIVELYGAVPAVITVPAILIKIEQQWHDGLTPEELYERTRRYWACNPEARRVPPRVAISVARGIVREVYDIERWEAYANMTTEAIDPTRLPGTAGKSARRRGFIGRVTEDSALRTSLLGKSVRHVPFGSGSPIAYAGLED